MATEGQEMTQIVENSPLLCSYFIILESSVIFVCQQSDLAEAKTGISEKADQSVSGTSLCMCLIFLSLSLSLSGCLLSQGDLGQLHTTLTEAFTCVVQILQTVKEFSNKASSAGENVESLTTAAVRVLGAWLAEETLALSSDVYRLLPFLIELCHNRLKQGEDKDLLKFLLPGLSHLTADDKPRRVLLKADLQKLLLAYMQHLVPLQQSSRWVVGEIVDADGALEGIYVQVHVSACFWSIM